MKRLTMILMTMLLSTASLWARPAWSKPVDVTQPDGTVVTLCLRGDEYLSFSTTVDGYTVIKCADGFYRYAEKTSEGTLTATSFVAHNQDQRTAEELSFLATQKKMIVPKMSESAKKRKEMAATMVSPMYSEKQNGGHRSPTSIWPHIDYNNFKGLVILVNWNDCTFTMDNPQDFYQRLTSEANYTDNSHTHYPVDVVGSARDYFRDNSMGIFDPTFDVVGPVTINYSCLYPHPNNEDGSDDPGAWDRQNKIIKAVLDQVNPTVDFADYDLDNNGTIDMVYMIFAGYGSYVSGNNVGYLWPHANDLSGMPSSWTGIPKYDNKKFGRYACSVEIQDYESQQAQHQYLDGIGTICHEFSHVLGLADHYDKDYDDHGQSDQSWFDYDVMASGADHNYGLSPVGYNAFERHMLGFAEPQELTAAGTYELSSFATGNQAYILKTGSTDDDFYLENRQKEGWDSKLPGHGLLVWRADTSNPSIWRSNDVNINANHNYFVLLTTAPKDGKLVDLTSTTVPALVSWAGKPAVMDLYDITEEGGVVTFTAGNDVYQSVVEDFENSPLSESGATGVTGKFCTWDLNNAAIEQTDGNKVAKLMRSGTLTSSTFENGIRSLTFTVKNGGQKIRFSLKVSTDGGSFSVINNTDGKGTVEIKANVEQTFTYRNIPANSQIQFLMQSTSTSAVCYLDDIAFTFPDNQIPTGIEEIRSQMSDVRSSNAAYNLQGQRVGENYKGLVIKNGKKTIVR